MTTSPETRWPMVRPAGQHHRKLGFLLDDLITRVSGIDHALIVSSDGLPMATSRGLPQELADQIAAAGMAVISLGRSLADLAGQGRCEHFMMRFTRGHLVFMEIGDRAGLVAIVKQGADLGTVAHHMSALVVGAGEALAPQTRDQALPADGWGTA